MIVLEICRIYGWTYYEYISQPQWFLDLATERLKIDAKRAEHQAKKK